MRKARPRAVYDAATGVNVQTSGTTVPGGALTGGGCIRFRVELSAIRALAAGNGLEDLDLFACTGVLDKVPDVDNALAAGVGALEAGVMRLYGVVVILGCVCVRCLDFSVLLMELRPPG